MTGVAAVCAPMECRPVVAASVEVPSWLLLLATTASAGGSPLPAAAAGLILRRFSPSALGPPRVLLLGERIEAGESGKRGDLLPAPPDAADMAGEMRAGGAADGEAKPLGWTEGRRPRAESSSISTNMVFLILTSFGASLGGWVDRIDSI
jgi:hypothetical protein